MVDDTESRAEKISKWTKKLVSFPTYRKDGKKEDKSFRSALAGATKWLQRWAERRNISFNNWEDRALQLQVGSGEPKTGIVAHIDVVPPGNEEWEIPDPFEVQQTRREDSTVLTGRGVVDDKGPLASLLVVLEDLKNKSDSFPGTVSLIIDTAEEIGLKNMRQYFKNNPEKLPDRTLVMDGYFPLVAGEKGLTWFDLEINFADETKSSAGSWKIDKITAGEAYNQVPDTARAQLSPAGDFQPVREEIDADSMAKIGVKFENNSLFVEAEGETAHGSTPGEGINAVGPLIGYLAELDFYRAKDEAAVEFFQHLVDEDNHYRHSGDWLDIEASDHRFNTGTTLNLGKMSYEDGQLKLGLDGRLMPDQPPANILAKLPEKVQKITPSGGRVKVNEVTSEEPLLIDLNRSLPAAALEAYRVVSGNPEAEPVYMGGRTDATAIPDSFAFGVMNFEEAEFYNFHGINERVRLEELVRAAQIYEVTLQNLTES